MNTSGPLIINLDGVTLSKDEAKLLENDIIGSVILFSHNYNNIEQIATLINDIKSDGTIKVRFFFVIDNILHF